jgi:hypothetical protein
MQRPGYRRLRFCRPSALHIVVCQRGKLVCESVVLSGHAPPPSRPRYPPSQPPPPPQQVVQSDLVAATDGSFLFLPVDVAPTAPSPLGSGSAVVVGRWLSSRSSFTASMFFASSHSDVLVQPTMAGLPMIWAPAASVTLSAVPLPQPPAAACSSPMGGVWGSPHWLLNLTRGGGGSLTGDCSALSVTAAVLVGGAGAKLLVVSGKVPLATPRSVSSSVPDVDAVCAATGWSLVATPRSHIDVRIFAIAIGFDGGAGGGGGGGGSALQGVLLAAKRTDGSASGGHVVSEDFVARDSKSVGERWVFPCSLAASAAAAPCARALLALLASCFVWW